MARNNAAKLITVHSNGQISIGKKWAGRQVRVEEVSEGELVISSGKFIPDRLATFHTPEAEETLKRYESWAAKNSPKETDTDALKARILKKKPSGAKK